MEKPHRKLDVWNLSMDLALQVYRATKNFPRAEMFGLRAQTRRAAVSIPSNIAEGAARQTRREFANFLHIAQASLSELDTQLEIARRLTYLEGTRWQELDSVMVRVDKMLTGLIRRQRSVG